MFFVENRAYKFILFRVRAPTADLPNVAGFLGGLVAQESIKMITKQYVPVNGHCVVDLVETRTGVVGG
jgi:NEDD8-activating enzyme E1 regulatory subunit